MMVVVMHDTMRYCALINCVSLLLWILLFYKLVKVLNNIQNIDNIEKFRAG